MANTSSSIPTSSPPNNSAPYNVSLFTNPSTTVPSITNLSVSIIGANAIFVPLAAGFVCARLFSRWKKGMEYGTDDWGIVIGLSLLIILSGISIDMVRQGLGRHISSLDHLEYASFQKLLFGFQLVYTLILETVKLSVLSMYTRIFPLHSFRTSAYIIGLFSIAWSISMLAVSLFQCTPLEKLWNPTLPGHCINFLGAIIGNAVPNIVTDILILALPMPLLWHLQTGYLQKIMLSGVFLLGGFVVCTSIYRFTTLLQYDPKDPTWTLNRVLVWSVIECSASIISSCLPTLGALVHFPALTQAIHRTSLSLATRSRSFAQRTKTWSLVRSRASSNTRRPSQTTITVTRMTPSPFSSSRRPSQTTITVMRSTPLPRVGMDGQRTDLNREERMERRERLEQRKRRKEVRTDMDVGDGLKRPAFFRLPSGRRDAGGRPVCIAAATAGQVNEGTSGDSRGLGGDGSGSNSQAEAQFEYKNK